MLSEGRRRGTRNEEEAQNRAGGIRALRRLHCVIFFPDGENGKPLTRRPRPCIPSSSSATREPRVSTAFFGPPLELARARAVLQTRGEDDDGLAVGSDDPTHRVTAYRFAPLGHWQAGPSRQVQTNQRARRQRASPSVAGPRHIPV